MCECVSCIWVQLNPSFNIWTIESDLAYLISFILDKADLKKRAWMCSPYFPTQVELAHSVLGSRVPAGLPHPAEEGCSEE